MAGAPQFAVNPENSAVTISTANANRDGTGATAVLITAPASGLRVDEISVKSTVTTTAGMVRFWLHDGTTFFFWKELAVPAITASGSNASFEAVLGSLALILKSGWSIRVATNNAERFDVAVTRAGTF